MPEAKQVSAVCREMGFWERGQRFICGKNHVFPENMDPARYSSAAVHCGVSIAKTMRLPMQRQGNGSV